MSGTNAAPLQTPCVAHARRNQLPISSSLARLSVSFAAVRRPQEKRNGDFQVGWCSAEAFLLRRQRAAAASPLVGPGLPRRACGKGRWSPARPLAAARMLRAARVAHRSAASAVFSVLQRRRVAAQEDDAAEHDRGSAGAKTRAGALLFRVKQDCAAQRTLCPLRRQRRRDWVHPPPGASAAPGPGEKNRPQGTAERGTGEYAFSPARNSAHGRGRKAALRA